MNPPLGDSVAERDEAELTRSVLTERRSVFRSWTEGFGLRGLIFAVVLFAAFFYMHHYMLRGWVSHDEGTLSQTAERVLRGEVPHRDFDDVYTGGLAYLNAIAFRIFGPTLASFRYMLMIFALAWTAAMYYCASRFLGALGAGVATLLAVAWGPANYFAALPSWYNLFFATFGIAALLRFTEVKHLRWLFLAGVCGGTSVVFKISGLYFIVAAGLWLIAGDAQPDTVFTERTRAGARNQTLLTIVGTFVYELFLLRLASTKWELPFVVWLFVPAAIAGIAVLAGRFRDTDRSANIDGSLKEVMAFVSGIAIPIAIFLVLYLRGGFGSLVYGVFVEPMRRLQSASFVPPHMGITLTSLAAIVFLIALVSLDWRVSPKLIGAIAAFALALVILRSAQNVGLYRRLWAAMFATLPVLVALGSWISIFGGSRTPAYRSKLLLVTLVAAMCALIQFPFSAPIYFCYVAALGVLLGAALVGGCNSQVKFNSGLIAVLLLAYVVSQVAPLFIHNLGWRNLKYEATYALKTPRSGGIRLPAGEGRIYDRIAQIVHDHAHGEYILATPDCPEMYFLTDHRNPTNTLYEFLTDSPDGDSNLLQLLLADHIDLIVLNSNPEFSPPIPQEFLATLEGEFPEHETVGPFDVRWRE